VNNTDRTRDEEEIRRLKEVFVTGFLNKDAKLRASIWTADGTVVPPQGGLFRGRHAMEKHFETEIASVTSSSKMSLSNYRFRFITPDVAFVDADITLNDVLGPDGQVHAVVPIDLFFTAVRQPDGWFVQDERAYFKPIVPNRQEPSTARTSDLIVIASAKAKPGKMQELELALREVGGPTRAQPGLVTFSLYRSEDDPSVIVGLERWASKGHHDQHLQGEHVQKLMTAMGPVLAEPPSIVSYRVLEETPN
jgi:uncharacterized protein (TIGR02246 family)